MKRVLVLAALPPLVALATVRPVHAAPVGYDRYGLTALAAGVRTSGDVGASGGLVTLDTGSASVSARLDSSPSSGALAAPYEPGTLARTGVGQVNDNAGMTVLEVPDAEAAYPGKGSGDLETVPPASGGGVTGSGGSASARATDRSASATATGSSLDVAGLVQVEGSTSTVSLAVDPVAGTTTATARTAVGSVVVAGVLELKDVVATARIATRGDTHTPFAVLSVGSATVAGQEVGITDQGVVAAGSPVVPGSTLESATATANSVLSAAGITIASTRARKSATSRSASADTGAVRISLVTPDLPGGVAGNDLEVLVGGVSLTELDSLPVEVPAVPDTVSPGTGTVAVPPVTTTTVVPGTAGTPGTPGVSAPQIAPEVVPTSYVVAGRRISGTAALAAFGVWQFLTLGSVSLYAMWDRRRRQQLAT